MNINALKAKMVLEGISTEKLAQEIGVSKSAFYRKLNGKTEFTREEIQKIIDVLRISNSDAFKIFFENQVS